MNAVSLRLCLFTGLAVGLASGSSPKSALSADTGIEAVNRVFAQHRKNQKEIWPLSGYPRYARVRPLQQSTFASLREHFSSRQRRNVDQFFHALNGLIDARDRLAKKLDIHEKWWPSGIDLLKVDAVLTQDVLTGRSEEPDTMSISTPKAIDGKLEITIQEAYTEHGQDRVLGRGYRTSIVTLIPEKDRWVIDEIRTTTTDAYGETGTATLTERLRKAVKPLHAAEHAIEKLPQTLEVKKGVKVEN
jgi:hypothetical protein